MKHAAKFEITELMLDTIELARNLIENCRIILGSGELQQLTHVGQDGANLLEIRDNALQRRAFLAERLRTFRIVPHVRFGQFELYLFEAVFAVGKVKDTP
jgi:hypothetical protein